MNSIPKDDDRGVGHLVKSALWMWGRSRPRRMIFYLRVAGRMWRAGRRRKKFREQIDGPIPSVVAISPTMRCNYNCQGCYSRGRSTENELTSEELDALLTEAEQLGVSAMVVTGGEPLLRKDTLDLIGRHRRLLFVLITNGSFVTPEIAWRIAKKSNLVVLVSIDGFPEDTDEMRRPGAHHIALRALESLGKAGACHGFAATATWANIDHLSTDLFIDQMTGLGCSVGYFTEYVPCGPGPAPDWTLSEEQRTVFRRRVLDFRRRKPVVLIQFPHDEYGPDNRCSAAGRKVLHINSQGDVEPCPFVPISRENVRHGGLRAAFESPFLRAIRGHPELLRRKRYACALWEHREEVKRLAKGEGKQPVQ